MWSSMIVRFAILLISLITPIHTQETTELFSICGQNNETDICTRISNSSESVPCDVCEGNNCPKNMSCRKKKGVCQHECICLTSWHVLHGERFCRASNPCLQPKPALCPLGQFECSLKDGENMDDYTCTCSAGLSLDTNTNTCVKVHEMVNVHMHFVETPYSEIFNNLSYAEAQQAQETIKASLSEIFGNLLVSLQFYDFSQGSLVANLRLGLRLNDNGTFSDNEFVFRKYILDCYSGKAPAGSKCFDPLGKVFLPTNAWYSQDQRCFNVFCPHPTRCHSLGNSGDSVQCRCSDGFQSVGSRLDSNGMLVESCLDIDECSSSTTICKDSDKCFNTEGSFQCANPCTDVSCPGHAECVIVGESYECQCSWIYSGASCSVPWTLIFLLLSIVLLLLITLFIVYIYLLKTRRIGKFHLKIAILPNISWINVN